MLEHHHFHGFYSQTLIGYRVPAQGDPLLPHRKLTEASDEYMFTPSERVFNYLENPVNYLPRLLTAHTSSFRFLLLSRMIK